MAYGVISSVAVSPRDIWGIPSSQPGGELGDFNGLKKVERGHKPLMTAPTPISVLKIVLRLNEASNLAPWASAWIVDEGCPGVLLSSKLDVAGSISGE